MEVPGQINYLQTTIYYDDSEVALGAIMLETVVVLVVFLILLQIATYPMVSGWY